MTFRLPAALAAALAILGASAVAQAADSPAQAAARKALTDLVPQAKIDAIEPAPMPGFQQIIVGSQLVYVSDDGKYIMQGKLFDTASQKDLTSSRLAIDVKTKLDAVPAARRIVFAPAGKPQYKITVFTDIDCGYCRKLHSQIAEYNKRGIEVDYLFFPRSGVGTESWDKAVSVWCAKDRKATFTAAKGGQTPPVLKCDNPIAEDFALGAQVGVDGTPAIFMADGVKIGGYLDPDQMLARLKAGAGLAAR
ncbi:MAG: DsbC family protein [Dokdonella sp.]|uniref:DsbC family protein n=1 Tax=Dokdonella sp. TaxID=2291710 RepID=UPI0025C28C90|nr:DsbC family protein [Dokdonella sp.]MBX3701154.1 DsbC family protein [Dokdonella sp.]